jgi:cell division protein FtsI (penicillin-binding protein 3)
MSAIKKSIIRRFVGIYIFIVIAFIAVIVKVVHVQYIEGDKWRDASKQNKKEDIIVRANRGNIYSAEGKLMASTIPEYSLFMDFVAVNRDTLYKYIDSLSYCLAKTLQDKSASQYKKDFLDGSRKKLRHYKISRKTASYIQYQEIRQFPLFRKGQNSSGFHTELRLKRVFPFGSLARRTIGNIYAESGIGSSGLEKYYNDVLMGKDGISTRQKVAGERIAINELDPEDGTDIITTINTEMQDIAEKALREKLSAFNAQEGCVVLMEVNTGEIKAISNLVKGNDGKYYESRNIAFSNMTEPGSTFKTASMIVALEENVVKPTDSIETYKGRYKFVTTYMTDHNHDNRDPEKRGFGKITVADAFAYSSNIGIARVINENFKDKPERFINHLYEIIPKDSIVYEIPGSARAKIPHPKNPEEWKAGDPTRLPWIAIGYNTQIPPIYTLQFYNAIANEGKMVKPMLVKGHRKNGSLITQFKTETINSSICSQSTLNQIKPMLEAVIERGTGTAVKSNLFKIAGKTGTAQINYGKNERTTHQLSFCGYFPADKPKYSAVVVIIGPNVGYVPGAGPTAGGVFKEIAESVYAKTANLPIYAMQIDSTAIKTPVSKNGNYNNLKSVFYKLDVETNDVENDWVKTSTSTNGVKMTAMPIYKSSVPDVVGMGAKDAVYLLESLGLKVQLDGVGTVKRQSVTAGNVPVKGQLVTLTLR